MLEIIVNPESRVISSNLLISIPVEGCSLEETLGCYNMKVNGNIQDRKQTQSPLSSMSELVYGEDIIFPVSSTSLLRALS